MATSRCMDESSWNGSTWPTATPHSKTQIPTCGPSCGRCSPASCRRLRQPPQTNGAATFLHDSHKASFQRIRLQHRSGVRPAMAVTKEEIFKKVQTALVDAL